MVAKVLFFKDRHMRTPARVVSDDKDILPHMYFTHTDLDDTHTNVNIVNLYLTRSIALKYHDLFSRTAWPR